MIGHNRALNGYTRGHALVISTDHMYHFSMDNKTPPISLGERMRLIRVARSMSQQAVADLMSDAGHNWTQVTVGKLERGERELKWLEGLTFSTIVGSLGSITSGDQQRVRDAAAYQRILRVIGENEADARASAEQMLSAHIRDSIVFDLEDATEPTDLDGGYTSASGVRL